jgi:hypothetical protein
MSLAGKQVPDGAAGGTPADTVSPTPVGIVPSFGED